MKRRDGFTLIEVSIVLVIIGLIVGGILVGRDLIEAAKLRSTIAQVEQYQTALNAFKVKYRYLPGDLLATQAAELGFIVRSGNAGSGDGNGLIEACFADGSTSTFSDYMGCENLLVWEDLENAGLISGPFLWEDDSQAVGISNFSTLLPQAKGLTNSYIHLLSKRVNAQLGPGYIFNIAYKNTLEVSGFTITDGSAAVGVRHTITPIQAENIDRKTDDGTPLLGRVLGLSSTGSSLYNLLTPPGNVCYYNGTTANAYAINGATAQTQICQMLFIM